MHRPHPGGYTGRAPASWIQPAMTESDAVRYVVTQPIELNIEEIVIGRDGLIVTSGLQRGVLLPQVATEHRWDRPTFLENVCRKAGLPADAWRRGAQLERFEAVVFGEGEDGGEL